MKKCASEIYARLVAAPVGARVSTRHANGISYSQSVESALIDQGYSRRVHFDSDYDYRTHDFVIIKHAEIRPYEEPKHDIKVGDVFTYSWGYEQTNIDFFQVVATTEKTVSIRKIKAGQEDYDHQFMSGHKVAIKNAFASDEIVRKTPYYFNGRWHINFDYGTGCKWDGKPELFTCYA